MMAETLAQSNHYEKLLDSKASRRGHDEFVKPLKYYRQEELKHMREDFYKHNTPYHPARKQFVYKIPATGTPERLAVHRRPNRAGEAVWPPLRESHNSQAALVTSIT
jgi:putative two-component system hydrogenase maturation factor HypX/HoxX